jgi:hypothetical protein
MDQAQFHICGCRRNLHAPSAADLRSRDPISKEGVLGHGKTVLLRERQYEVVAVEEMHVQERLWWKRILHGCSETESGGRLTPGDEIREREDW